MLGNGTIGRLRGLRASGGRREPRCVASLRALRGTECPPERGGCGGIRWRGEARTHLLLPVPGRGAAAPIALEGLIEVAVQPERLDLGRTFLCPACGPSLDPIRLTRYEEPPLALAIHLMRFRCEGARLVKSCVPVRCPQLLRFQPEGHHEGATAHATYELRAIRNHKKSEEIIRNHTKIIGNHKKS